MDYNVAIKIGAVEIRPGDYIIGDRDGVIAVPRPAAEDVLAKAERVVATETLFAGIFSRESIRLRLFTATAGFEEFRFYESAGFKIPS